MRSFKIVIKIRGCDIIFKEDMGPGVIMTQIVDIPEGYSDYLIGMKLHEVGVEMMHESVDMKIEEVT